MDTNTIEIADDANNPSQINTSFHTLNLSSEQSNTVVKVLTVKQLVHVSTR